jgi:hypothetical protein
VGSAPAAFYRCSSRLRCRAGNRSRPNAISMWASCIRTYGGNICFRVLALADRLRARACGKAEPGFYHPCDGARLFYPRVTERWRGTRVPWFRLSSAFRQNALDETFLFYIRLVFCTSSSIIDRTYYYLMGYVIVSAFTSRVLKTFILSI